MNLKEKKTKKTETKKVAPEITLDIHRMPKGYKIGRFESNKGSGRNSSKKTGGLIIALGLVLILFLAYLIFSYISQPNFSWLDSLKLPKLKQPIATTTDIIPKDNESQNQNQSPEEIPATSSETMELPEDESDQPEEDEADSEDIKEEEPVFVLLDSDGDGLSDDEEFILDTDFLQADSDGDTFNDGLEVGNLYNPIGDGPINNNVNIVSYQNKAFAYSILHPNVWARSVSSDESSLVLSIDNDAYIQILVEANYNYLSIKDWYTDRFLTMPDNEKMVSHNQWDGLYSSDDLALYLTDKERKNVYTILYNTTAGQVKYQNIFSLIINSFKLN